MVDKMLVAQGVANRVYATEAAIDAAMVEASQMMSSIISAQGELRLAACVTDGAIAKIAEAVSTLAAARQQVVASHAELAEVKLRLGIRTKMMGEHQKKPTSSSAVEELRAVG
ncbi:MAG: hypothetical protein INR64_06930 [Caulobacteraceae bacterium]|nr:hypothetical protein [Caulobacter sp.]